MRVVAAVLIFAGANAVRRAVAFRADGSQNAAPRGGSAFDHGPSERSSAETPGVQSDIPGYRVHEGKRCSGTWIQFWENGDLALYGQSDSGHEYTEPLACARECNEHPECSGFHTRNGICSHWHSGELHDVRLRHAFGHNCYVKWEIENLDDVNLGPAMSGGGVSLKRPEGPQISDCLCVFDIDRTLTARQGWNQCQGTEEQHDVPDYHHNGGELLLSDLARGIKESAACGHCYYGMVSHGTASGPGSLERGVLDGLVEPQFDVGGYVEGCPSPVTGTKVMACGRNSKPRAVQDIVAWLGGNGVTIQPDRVHFFDDKAHTVNDFVGGPYNAHQVSCSSRDGGERGGCGGTRAELNNIPVGPAQHFC